MRALMKKGMPALSAAARAPARRAACVSTGKRPSPPITLILEIHADAAGLDDPRNGFADGLRRMAVTGLGIDRHRQIDRAGDPLHGRDQEMARQIFAILRAMGEGEGETRRGYGRRARFGDDLGAGRVPYVKEFHRVAFAMQGGESLGAALLFGLVHGVIPVAYVSRKDVSFTFLVADFSPKRDSVNAAAQARANPPTASNRRANTPARLAAI